ncbi:unnamed protein product, partial [marine sediment metagenome]
QPVKARCKKWIELCVKKHMLSPSLLYDDHT